MLDGIFVAHGLLFFVRRSEYPREDRSVLSSVGELLLYLNDVAPIREHIRQNRYNRRNKNVDSRACNGRSRADLHFGSAPMTDGFYSVSTTVFATTAGDIAITPADDALDFVDVVLRAVLPRLFHVKQRTLGETS